ncbi:hypothetical protein Micbo1qcDRAFT_39195 [Microdochium bolleyi]|uniref:Uncharacterized protein n=1 Tax=Microdochium bolleyi TaxID=196109 RepID=A0A136J9E7_9PEZI|nr:hypothetical protein Micbo1qcDRAFT_39195 [Microdochium bolleyi]
MTTLLPGSLCTPRLHHRSGPELRLAQSLAAPARASLVIPSPSGRSSPTVAPPFNHCYPCS